MLQPEKVPGAPVGTEPTAGPEAPPSTSSGSPYVWPVLIALAVVAANLPGIVGITNVNPLDSYSGLTRSRGTQLIPGVSSIDINVGATSQALGHRAALDWLHGHVPWWNPYEGVGTPLAAGMQAAAFFPPVLLLAWSGGQLPFRLLLEYGAGLATYFLLRRLGVSNFVAGIGGIVYALDGTFAWFQHAAINPVAFLPAALLGVEIARDRPLGDWRALLLPAALALSIVSGFPETAAIDGGLVALWALWRIVERLRETDGREGLRLALRLGVLGVSGVLLTSPLVLAFRSYLTQGNVGAHSSMSHVHLQPAGLLTLIDPYVTGPLKGFVPTGQPSRIQNLFTTNSGYVLVSGAVLALIGLVYAKREWGLRLLMAMWIAVFTARDYGFGPAVRLLAHIPYLKEAAVFRTALPSTELVVVLLAALGIDAIVAARNDRPVRRLVVALAAAVTGAVLLGLALGPARTVLRLVSDKSLYPTDPHPYLIGALIGTIVILVGLGIAGALGRQAAAIGLGGIFVLEAFGSFFYPQLAGARSPKLDLAPVAYLQRHLGNARFYSLYANPSVGPDYGGPIAPNYGSYFGLASVDYLDIPDPALFVHYVNGHLDSGAGSEFFGTTFGRHPGAPSGLATLRGHSAALAAIGVKYIVTGAKIPLAAYAPAARRVFDDGLAAIWLLPHPAPFFSTGRGACSVTEVSTDRAVTKCREGATLVRQELAMPGWSATVNGRPAGLRTADGSLFAAVAVPSGTATVVYSYHSPHLRLGEILAMIALAMLIVPFLVKLARRRARSS